MRRPLVNASPCGAVRPRYSRRRAGFAQEVLATRTKEKFMTALLRRPAAVLFATLVLAANSKAFFQDWGIR